MPVGLPTELIFLTVFPEFLTVFWHIGKMVFPVVTWCRWTRFSRATAAAFTYMVLVGIKGVPAHALSAMVAQQLLGLSCAQVELASSDADGVDEDDARELFVAAL